MPSTALRSLGHKVIEFRGLDAIELSDGHVVQAIEFVSDEVTALCPVTNQPDWYTITIILNPILHTIESKSLKIYLHEFRNQGIFAEELATKICQDVANAVTPYRCKVEVRQKSRGGITLTALARYST